MTAGRLNQRITVQHYVAASASLGEKVKNWADLFVDLSAEVLTARGREDYEAGQFQNEATIRFCVRYRTGIDSTMRIIWKDKIYAIMSDPVNWKGRNEWLYIDAKSGARDGR